MANTNSNSINNITSKVPKSFKGIAVFGFGSIVPMQLFYNHVKQQQLQPSYRSQFHCHQQQLQFSSLSSSNFNNIISNSNNNNNNSLNNINNINNINTINNLSNHNDISEIESPINKDDKLFFYNDLKSLNTNNSSHNNNDINDLNNFNNLHNGSMEYSLVSSPARLSSKDNNLLYNDLNFNTLHQLPSNIINTNNTNNVIDANNSNQNDLFTNLNESLFNEVIKRAEIKQLAWEVNDINF
ncbi:uncharacterized protein ASCRUDRAFT_15912 [Ascoidea rubescens DSM 1968]|uniref:Uncharacterized protein n=1 Tax=Ascoidea rubescens DSM 1968 TaxID=1344418 RepID=A0A1D2V911_9ASCO|nr:hypothetical protein ASCRUDRAFT_15912 [Ascoidea rubescens DSM 1968]ODV58118.1 hypothetical protein ASCRUDRAFT_15912 [Ascoidea rubescens DSM 1968]